MLVFVGSAGAGTPYLKEPSRGKSGVSCYQLGQDGSLQYSAGPFEIGENPTAIAPRADNSGLFISSETYGNNANSTVWSADIQDTTTGELRFLGACDAGGRACCHLMLHPSGKYLGLANYLGEAKDPANRGTFRLCRVDSEDGTLEGVAAHMAHEGSFPGANTGRQEAAHVHGSVFVPMKTQSTHALLVCDLGCDSIFQYVVNADGQATPNATARIRAHKAGAGPRHIALHPKHPFVYVINELDSTIQGHSFDAETGSLSLESFQVVSALPPGDKRAVEGDQYSCCAAIEFHPTGNFLYGSNRGHDSIVIFQVASDGKLTWKANELTGGYKITGMGPRDFAVSPCGSLMVVANQDMETLVSYKINQENGLLTRLCIVTLTAPVSVCILPAFCRGKKRRIEEVSTPLDKPSQTSVLPVAGARFTGLRVLVTGGAMGIGNGIAESFSAEGATVIVADIHELPGSSKARFIRCDCSNAQEIERCCSEAGPVDILINNVAVQPEGPCHEHSLEQWDKAISTNLTSYFLFAKHALPYMLQKKKGVIINIASVQGSQSQPGIPGYAAAKGGVISLTRQLGVEYGSQGIRVNAVSPGTIGTPLVEGILKKRGTTPEQAGAVYPMKRIGKIEEIARVVLFLCSEEAAFITAENINVDGGIMGLGGWATVA